MPLPSAIKLFIDPRTGNAFGNFSGTSSLTNPVFTLGDTATIELYLVEDTGLSAYPRQEIGFPTSPGIKVALGAIDESPLAGTWKLSYGGDTTTALAYNATPAAVQAALNLLASITAAGGVAVSKIGDNYNIVFNSNGARTELTTDAAALIPLSTAAVATLQEGDATKPAIYLVHLQRTVAGLATNFTPTTASAITVDALTAWDGSKATYRVSISPDPKGGSFSLAFDAQTGTDVSTSAISVGATALDVQNALNIGALAGKVSVTQVKAYAYDISVTTQPGTNGLTASAAGLLSYSGYKGELNLNTAEAISLLDGAPSVQTTLEVEITSESKTLTVLQITCTLHNAVIDAGAVDPLVLDTYLSQTTADGRYFKLSQNLADGTAGTMRTNLGVYSTSQVNTALALKADISNPTFTDKIYTPAIRNILNADLVIDSYNDTGAGTHYLHKFTPNDGNLVLASNGGGLTFPDGTTQTTAAFNPDLSGYRTDSNYDFTNVTDTIIQTYGVNLNPPAGTTVGYTSFLQPLLLKLSYDISNAATQPGDQREATIGVADFKARYRYWSDNEGIIEPSIGTGFTLTDQSLTFTNWDGTRANESIVYNKSSITFGDNSVQTIAFPGFNNAALTGNPTAPSQSVNDNSTRLVNTATLRDNLVDCTWSVPPIVSTTTVTSGAGATYVNASPDFGYLVGSNANTAGFCQKNFAMFARSNSTYGFNFTRNIKVGCKIALPWSGTFAAITQTLFFRLVTGTTNGTLTQIGFGISINLATKVLSILAHNGTTLTTKATSWTPPAQGGISSIDFMIESNGAGTVFAYADGVLIDSTDGMSTATNSGTTTQALAAVEINSAGGTSTAGATSYISNLRSFVAHG